MVIVDKIILCLLFFGRAIPLVGLNGQYDLMSYFVKKCLTTQLCVNRE